MQSVPLLNAFNEIYVRRDEELSDEDIEIAKLWSSEMLSELTLKWQSKGYVEKFTIWLASNATDELLRKLFWGVSFNWCCERHMCSCPVAIDTDENTPIMECYEVIWCDEPHRHNLRNIRAAFKMQSWNKY
jgi:hypothetical protein